MRRNLDFLLTSWRGDQIPIHVIPGRNPDVPRYQVKADRMLYLPYPYRTDLGDGHPRGNLIASGPTAYSRPGTVRVKSRLITLVSEW